MLSGLGTHCAGDGVPENNYRCRGLFFYFFIFIFFVCVCVAHQDMGWVTRGGITDLRMSELCCVRYVSETAVLGM